METHLNIALFCSANPELKRCAISNSTPINRKTTETNPAQSQGYIYVGIPIRIYIYIYGAHQTITKFVSILHVVPPQNSPHLKTLNLVQMLNE